MHDIENYHLQMLWRLRGCAQTGIEYGAIFVVKSGINRQVTWPAEAATRWQKERMLAHMRRYEDDNEE